MTKIEWVKNQDGTQGVTWNPVTGCTKTSPGCAHCYAERMANRLAHNPATAKDYAGTIENGKWTGRVNCLSHKLDEPLKWRKPRMVFVNSMSDLFHESIPFEFIHQAFVVMQNTPRHIHQVLTKRADRMLEFAHWEIERAKTEQDYIPWPLSNVWSGVTVCNQEEADTKIPLLLQTPAAVRFVSIEPMLESIQLGGLAFGQYEDTGGGDGIHPDIAFHDFEPHIDWVICGGETGHGARPMHPQWTRDLRDQCKAADVPFFFKGWGDWLPISQMPDGHADTLYHPAPKRDPESIRQCKVAHSVIQAVFPMGAMTVFRVGKKAAGRFLDGVEHSELPGQEVAK